MRNIDAGLFVSLDGVVESPEKWTGPYFNDQVGQAVGKLMAANDAMLLGRTTYEGFAAAFGGQSGGMADQMNNTPKFVVSSTLTSADWQNSTLINGTGDDVAEHIRELKQRPGRSGGIRFLFDCGQVSDAALAGLKLQPEEVSESRLVSLPDALALLRGPIRRRVQAATQGQDVVYLEDGHPVLP